MYHKYLCTDAQCKIEFNGLPELIEHLRVTHNHIWIRRPYDLGIADENGKQWYCAKCKPRYAVKRQTNAQRSFTCSLGMWTHMALCHKKAVEFVVWVEAFPELDGDWVDCEDESD